jgi:predicted membrane channel-forming protein YqfA (hemolysin III family)
MKNKKGQFEAQTFDIFTFIIFSFLVVVFFAGLIYTMGLINTVMHNAGLSNEVNSGSPYYTNMTLASDMIFGQQAEAIKALRMVAIVYILSIAVVIVITNALIKKNPLWFFAYILLSLLAVIFAPQVSNAYENLLSSGIFEGELNNFTASNWILLNLPWIVLVISVLGGIFLFVNLIRSPAESGGL